MFLRHRRLLEARAAPPPVVEVASAAPTEAPPPPAEASASATPPPVTPAAPSKFDPAVARTAVEDLGSKLGDCKLVKGRPILLKIRFATSGKVAGVAAIGTVNKAQVTCIVGHVHRDLALDPFEGDPPPAAMYTIVPK